MNTCTTEQEYINKIALSVQRACKRYGYLPSVLIAQSCLENGYGIPDYWDNPEIEKLLKANNMVGIKSELLGDSWDDYTVWQGESITKKTPEEYDGEIVPITDEFRKYDTIERSFCDFLLFLTYGSNYGKDREPKYGKEVLEIKDPETLIREVASRGYATGRAYPNHVMSIVKKHNLTKYDDLSKIEKTIYTPGYKKETKNNKEEEKMSTNIIKIGNKKINDITARNRYQVPASRGSQYPNFIVVHYLGVPNADNPDLYGGGYGGHYNIKRDGTIYKAADPCTAVVWQCGGGLQGSGGHSFYKICTNYNSIGIECGVCANTSARDLSGDSNLWYFTEQTQESLVWLVSKLMDDFDISFDHVIRHYDVTGKICPNPYVKNNSYKTSWTWTQFKNNLKQYRKDGTITNPNKSSSSTVPIEQEVPDDQLILKRGQSGFGITEMQTMLIACGYSCGYAGADGKFGTDTQKALKAFQKDNNLKIDGVYGPNSRKKLTELYNSKKNQSNKKETKEEKTVTVSIQRNKFIDAVENVYLLAHQNQWKYGNSKTLPPCEDKMISCDRLEARALYDLGFTDQRKGGETCTTFSKWFSKHGWTKTTNKKKIKPGAVIAVKYPNHNYIDHIFTVISYNSKSGICSKYDTGSNQRILSKQPYTNVKLLEWKDREFVCAWNPPSDMTQNITVIGKYDSQKVTFGDVSYKAVYDYNYYKNKYKDLQNAFGDNKDLYFKHFCQFGMKEGRIAKKTFNVKKYKEKYEDLRKKYGSNLMEYYKHYCLYGKKEGRKAT